MVEHGCQADVERVRRPKLDIVEIPSKGDMLCGMNSWNLRALREVSLQSGLERVGDGWCSQLRYRRLKIARFSLAGTSAA